MYSLLSDSSTSLVDHENIPAFSNVSLKLEYQSNSEETDNNHAGTSSTFFVPKQECSYSCRLKIDRTVFENTSLSETFQDNELISPSTQGVPKKDLKYLKIARNCLFTSVPSLVWLGKYKWKEDLVSDIVAGCTVAVMNIPQGMAYALLGNVPPVVGIYMAIFPVIAYAFLGTSRHVSMGSFAVICLMTGNVVNTYANTNTSGHGNVTLNDVITYSPLEVATAVTFTVGIYQVGMYVFQLGIMCSLLSDTLVNGLTAGAAIHVLTSQIKDLFGMEVDKFTGKFQLVYTYISIIDNLDKVNIAACVLSIITITVLLLNNVLIKPWVSKRSLIPVPIELLTIISGTYVSSFWGIADTYGLTTVGDIAIGLPALTTPTFSLVPLVAWESFVIAVIAYVISMSMALIFSQKLNYEIDANQELLAQGAGNLVGSCFSCLPFSASLSRSVIQQSVGGRTQLASIVSICILLVVITLFAQIFETLPRCILASLIVIALKGVLWQVKDVIKIRRLSSVDGIIWLVTYLTVIIVEIDVGLLVGVILSNLNIFTRGIRPSIYQLARLPNTEIYVDSKRYKRVEDIDGICIVHYSGALNFANQRYFKHKVTEIVKNRLKSGLSRNLTLSKAALDEEFEEVEYLILDMTAVHYADPSGAQSILVVVNDYCKGFICTLLAVAPGPVYDVLHKCGVFRDNKVKCFPTVHDAVVFSENNKSYSSQSNGL